MTGNTTTVSNGREFYRIPVSDLDEARGDGFYVPAERQRTIVSNGDELFEIPLADLDEARRDGFRDLLAGELQKEGRSTTVAPVSAPEAEAAPAAVISATDIDEPADDEEPGPGLGRRRTVGIITVSVVIHAVTALVMLIMRYHAEIEDRFAIISALSTIDQEEMEFEEVVEIQPDQVKSDSEMQVVQDLITDSNELIEIDLNDLDISSAIPERKEGAGNPVAKITGELGGRSRAGRSALVARYGGNAASEAAVRAGLKWLVEHQSSDGSWSFDHTRAVCAGSCSQPGSLKKSQMGATSMAVLALLGAGHTHGQGDYRKQVWSGLNYLLSNAKQTPDGLDLRGAAEGNSGMYIQGLATITLCEALAMSEAVLKTRPRGKSRNQEERVDRKVLVSSRVRLRQGAQLALNFIMRAQNTGSGGWGYTPRKGGDTSVLGWQVMALKSGHTAHLNVLSQTIQGATGYLDSVQTNNGAGYGYNSPQRRSSTTAVGLLSRMYMGWNRKHPALEEGVRYLGGIGPLRNNMYYNYYATQVMHHWGGDPWEKWNTRMRDQLVTTQVKTGHATGSWKVADGHGGAGGRLYMTCLCVMTLEIYYRHLPLYQDPSSELKSAASKKTRGSRRPGRAKSTRKKPVGQPGATPGNKKSSSRD